LLTLSQFELLSGTFAAGDHMEFKKKADEAWTDLDLGAMDL